MRGAGASASARSTQSSSQCRDSEAHLRARGSRRTRNSQANFAPGRTRHRVCRISAFISLISDESGTRISPSFCFLHASLHLLLESSACGEDVRFGRRIERGTWPKAASPAREMKKGEIYVDSFSLRIRTRRQRSRFGSSQTSGAGRKFRSSQRPAKRMFLALLKCRAKSEKEAKNADARDENSAFLAHEIYRQPATRGPAYLFK